MARGGGAPMSDPFTVNDVLDAHDFLEKYQGDAVELFSFIPPRRFTEWQLVGLCPLHGRQTNTVTTDLGQEPQNYVVCAGCLERSRMTRLAPVLILKITEEA